MSVITLPAQPSVSVRAERFRLLRSEAATETLSGIGQITTYPDRRWAMQINVIPQRGANLRLWALAAFQLSTLSNVFAYGPPHYSAPGTGYAGSNPLVSGADQLGLSLVVDGLPNSTPILSVGDFCSFDTVSTQGNTNRQLNMVTMAVNSDGGGVATLNLLLPIRQAPADDATVNILTPTAFFRSAKPEQLVDLDVDEYSPFTFDVVERIFP